MRDTNRQADKCKSRITGPTRNKASHAPLAPTGPSCAAPAQRDLSRTKVGQAGRRVGLRDEPRTMGPHRSQLRSACACCSRSEPNGNTTSRRFRYTCFRSRAIVSCKEHAAAASVGCACARGRTQRLSRPSIWAAPPRRQTHLRRRPPALVRQTQCNLLQRSVMACAVR